MASVNLLRLPAFQGRFNDSTISVVPAPELLIWFLHSWGCGGSSGAGRSDAGHAGDAVAYVAVRCVRCVVPEKTKTENSVAEIVVNSRLVGLVG